VTGFSDGTSDWMVALDVKSGRELWRYRMAEETYRGHDGSDDGPVATPTIHGGQIYGLTPRGRLFALRLADGEQVWTRQLVDELGAFEPLWGFNSSPTVIGGVLVMQTGGGDGHSISALDPATGELLWSTGDDAVYYESPIALRFGDEEQIFALTNEYILGLVPETGEVLWRQEHKVDESAYTGYMQPVPLGDGRVLLTAWTESVLVRIEKAGEAYEVDELWRTRVVTIAGVGAVPVPYEGYIYGFKRQFLSCVDATTGETMWRSRSPGGGNLVVVDGHLVILARSGEVVVAAATPEGYREETRAPALDEGFYTRPTFAGGRIFIRNLSSIAGLAITGEAPPAVVDTREEEEEVELLGEVGELVRRVDTAENKTQLVDEFMVAHHEFPILEADGLVHFVFRGKVEDLALKGSMKPLDEELIMHRLEGTDFYFRSMRLEPGAYHTYSFAVFDEPRLDPLNPRKPDNPEQEQSAFATPGWQEPLHLREPEGDRGRIETLTWKSETLGNEREVQVYLPPGYDDGEERYPLLLDLSGGDAIEFGRRDRTLDNLVGKTVAPLVVAFVPRQEYSEYGSDIETFQQALAEELVSLLDESYRTAAKPAARGVMGGFTRGTASIYMTLKRPDVFSRAAGQSIRLRSDLEAEINDLLKKNEKRDLRFYVEWSTHDLKAGAELDCRADSQRLAGLLEKHGYKPTVREVVQGITSNDEAPNIYWVGWRQSTDHILETLFPLE
jgi:outer membrane protein assembly factor BamB/enterochelin esterase-like enzyme